MSLHEHNFLTVNIGGKVAALLERINPRRRRGAVRLTSAEEYARAVLFAASEFVSTIDQMKYAVISLSGYRQVRAERSRFAPTRLDHLIYRSEERRVGKECRL